MFLEQQRTRGLPLKCTIVQVKGNFFVRINIKIRYFCICQIMREVHYLWKSGCEVR